MKHVGAAALARRDCVLAGSSADHRDQHIVELDTLFYDWPHVFGLEVSARWVPPAPGWGAHFNFSEDGQSVLGEGFGLDFSFYAAPAGAPQSQLHLGSSYSYPIYETQVQYLSSQPLREDLAGYIASPEAMRERGLEQMEAALKKVEDKLRLHQVTRCEYGPYKGNGIPPVCNSRPLTPTEEQAALSMSEAGGRGSA
jgi:hypothetical protein